MNFDKHQIKESMVLYILYCQNIFIKKKKKKTEERQTQIIIKEGPLRSIDAALLSLFFR